MTFDARSEACKLLGTLGVLSIQKDTEMCESFLRSLVAREVEEAEIKLYGDVVRYLAGFHGSRCHPEEGECACWTETIQKHFQARARVLKTLDKSQKEGA